MQKAGPDDRKYLLLAKKIEQIFEHGFVLSDEIMHYINSTFLNPSMSKLEEIIRNKDDCERDSLIELLFFPDESTQIKLEEFLECKGFKKKDEEKVLNYILDKKLLTTIRFPESEDSLRLFLPKSSAGRFLSRLNISRNPDKRLVKAIDQFVSDNCKTAAKVRLRNAKVEFTENRIAFLCSFFQKLKVKDNLFLKCLDFILDFFDTIKDDKNIMQSLLEKKESYFKDLEKASRIEDLLSGNNMETLISRGIRIPHISKEDAMHNILTIDTIIFWLMADKAA